MVRRDWRPTVRIGDSKKLSEPLREVAFHGLLQDPGVVWAVVSVTAQEIDAEGVYRALLRAHTEAQAQAFLAAGSPASCERIVDGVIPVPLAMSLPKADQLIPACSAASILAKVTRDRCMVKFAAAFPGYGFASGKGYGTRDHEAALEKLGPCCIHRRSYAPIARFFNTEPKGLWEEFGDE